jgi:hypothetical protein
MRICILTRYHHHEATYAAIQLHDLFQQLGFDVYLRAVNARPVQLCPERDAQLVQCSFDELLHRSDVIVWTHVPYAAELSAAHALGKLTCVIPMWLELCQRDRRPLQRVGVLACPHLPLVQVFESWPKITPHYTPWYPGLPLTRKNSLRAAGELHVLFALFDNLPSCVDASIFNELLRLLELLPQLHVTVGFSPKNLTRNVLARLRTTKARYGERLQLAKNVHYNDRPLLYAKHDLTVWPTIGENIGIVGLESLCMGTPVFAWNVPPLTDFLHPKAATLVPCTQVSMTGGAILAAASIYSFSVELQQLLLNPDKILAMQQHTMDELPERQVAFKDFWQNALYDASCS